MNGRCLKIICLIFIGNIEYCPYLYKYEKLLKESGTDYKVLYWNREGLENDSIDYIAFEKKSIRNKNKVFKVFDFIKFNRWLKSQKNNYQFDKIIYLDTLSAVISTPSCLKNRKKYILDIRDYSYENNKLFYFILKIIIKNSYMTTISSKGFKKFLPKHNYYLNHNTNIFTGKGLRSSKTPNSKIVIGWVGSIRYFNSQKELIKLFQNDDRFILVYYGDGPELGKFKKFVNENEINNVIFKGRYNEEEKPTILESIDIINNVYDLGKGSEVKYAIPNRYYDGLVTNIPQISEAGSYKADLIEEYNIGLVFNSNQNFTDKVYKYYIKNCADENISRKLLQTYKKDDEKLEKKLKNFFMK